MQAFYVHVRQPLEEDPQAASRAIRAQLLLPAGASKWMSVEGSTSSSERRPAVKAEIRLFAQDAATAFWTVSRAWSDALRAAGVRAGGELEIEASRCPLAALEVELGLELEPMRVELDDADLARVLSRALTGELHRADLLAVDVAGGHVTAQLLYESERHGMESVMYAMSSPLIYELDQVGYRVMSFAVRSRAA